MSSGIVNCLSYALRFWSQNKTYKIVYNSDHVINVPIKTEVQGFLALHFFGIDYFRISFRDLLTPEDVLLLKEYMQWEEKLQ